ncbi:MBL fold metallo-hydrolase [Gordonia sp. NPDC003424]
MPTVIHHVNAAVIRRLRMRGRHLVCHIAVLETDRDGLILVDTGLGTADYADIGSRLGAGFARGYAHPLVNPELAVVNQLRASGFDADDVRHIVMTHLDLDHVGGLSDFPHATVHVSAAELRNATIRHSFRDKQRYRPPMWAHGPHWQTYTASGEQWLGFEAVRELTSVHEPIALIPLAGHTLGHCGVAVETSAGWTLAAGDAIFDARQLDPQPTCAPMVRAFQAMVTTDRRLRDHNQGRLRELLVTHPDVDIYAAHDPWWHPDRFGLSSSRRGADAEGH